MKFIHALNKNIYVPVRPVVGGVEFKVMETGEVKYLTNHQILKLLSRVSE